jgi:hypothetical protein
MSSAGFDASVPSLGGNPGPTLASGARQTEASAELGWGGTVVGLSMDAFALRYRVTDPTPPGVPPPTPGTFSKDMGFGWGPGPLNLGGHPTIVAAYAERTWGPADSAWQLSTGLRASALTGQTPRLEPRISGALRLTDAVTATAAFARTHQYLQSLRNTSSPAGAQLGIDLPVAAGTGGLPVAQGDAATLGLETRLPSGTRVTVDGYVRRLSGLAAVNPEYPDAFATDAFDRASAHVTGATVEIDGGIRQLMWNADYGWATTTERFGQMIHQPTTQVGQTLQVGLGWQLNHATQLRLATWAAVGRISSAMGSVAPPRDDDATPGDGTTAHANGAMWLPMANVPPYLRTDISLVRDWRIGHGTGRLSAFLTLANVFDHANIALYIPHASGTPSTPITLLPRTLLAGASVGY